MEFKFLSSTWNTVLLRVLLCSSDLVSSSVKPASIILVIWAGMRIIDVLVVEKHTVIITARASRHGTGPLTTQGCSPIADYIRRCTLKP